MTTIAWKEGVLASDSRMTSNRNIISDRTVKLFKLDRIMYCGDILLYCGLAGSTVEYQRYLHFIHEDAFYEEESDCEVSGIAVGEKFVYYIEPNDSYLIRMNRNDILAAGSGQDFAMSAMILGLSAPEAVKHAIKLDSVSGGKVQQVSLGSQSVGELVK